MKSHRYSKICKPLDNSAAINQITFTNYYEMLKNLALNIFEWTGLPDTIDPRFLEITLFEKGYGLYFKDEIIGDLFLTTTIQGPLDLYRIPINRKAYAVNGYQKECDSSNSVLIFNNYLHTPSENPIQMYAQRLYEIQRAIDTNVNFQKFSGLILTPETQRMTLENLMLKFESNVPFVYGNNDFDINSIQTLKFDVPFVADKLYYMLHQTLNSALSFLGIENSNQDKKERLVSEEVSGNSGIIESQRNVMLNSRKDACKKINKMFGTNIDVRFRSDLHTLVNGFSNKENQTNESLYNPNQMDRGDTDS